MYMYMFIIESKVEKYVKYRQIVQKIDTLNFLFFLYLVHFSSLIFMF